MEDLAVREVEEKEKEVEEKDLCKLHIWKVRTIQNNRLRHKRNFHLHSNILP